MVSDQFFTTAALHWLIIRSFYPDEQDEKVIAVNTIGVMKGTKVALLHLAKRGGGVIVCTSSVAGFHVE